MAHFGIEAGAILLTAVVVVAGLLARKAAQGVREFRREDHVQFLGKPEP